MWRWYIGLEITLHTTDIRPSKSSAKQEDEYLQPPTAMRSYSRKQTVDNNPTVGVGLTFSQDSHTRTGLIYPVPLANP
jgi:hypothetical protein